MTNPYVSLLRTAWRYAKTERKRFLSVYALFICSNLVSALNPVLLGWFINKIQQDNARTIMYEAWYSDAYLMLKILDWSFHGPARIMERELAFNLSRNFPQ